MMQFSPEELAIKAEELKRIAARLLEEADSLMRIYQSFYTNRGTPERKSPTKPASSPVLKFPR